MVTSALIAVIVISRDLTRTADGRIPKLSSYEKGSIPNILKVLERIGTLKPKMFGLIDFTAGYHQTTLSPYTVVWILI